MSDVKPSVPATDEVLLRVNDVRKHFPVRGGLLGIRAEGAIRAVDGVSFTIRRGETLGLVGESGCGKSTLGRLILRLIEPTAGDVYFDGQSLFSLPQKRMREVRRHLQIVFQDPYASLDPRMTVGEIVGEGLLVHGVHSRAHREELVRDVLAQVGLSGSYINRYPHEFSGGQRQRIGIARALVLKPKLLVCDEPVSSLDVSIQSQVLNLLNDLQRDLGLTYLFIAHNLAVVQHVSDRVAVMYLGRVVELGAVDELYEFPRHPYTIALISAVLDPSLRSRRKRLVLHGDVPSPANPPSGCRFHTRCWLRERLSNPDRCVTEEPLLRDVAADHLTACHFAEELSTPDLPGATAWQVEDSTTDRRASRGRAAALS